VTAVQRLNGCTDVGEKLTQFIQRLRRCLSCPAAHDANTLGRMALEKPRLHFRVLARAFAGGALHGAYFLRLGGFSGAARGTVSTKVIDVPPSRPFERKPAVMLKLVTEIQVQIGGAFAVASVEVDS
jgi:hypothetical protein